MLNKILDFASFDSKLRSALISQINKVHFRFLGCAVFCGLMGGGGGVQDVEQFKSDLRLYSSVHLRAFDGLEILLNTMSEETCTTFMNKSYFR